MKKIINYLLQYKVFLFFSLLIFISKVFYSYYMDFNGLTFEDWDIANNLVKYHVYAEFIAVGPTAYKLPLYPLFLSLFIYAFDENAKIIITVVQHIIYFFIPVLFILISRIFNKERIGIMTGYLFILSPAYFFYSNTFEITNIFIFVFLIFLYCFSTVWVKGYSWIRIIMLACTASLLFLGQVIAVPISLILIFSLFFFRKIKCKQLIFVLGLTSILYSPWVIRNYIVFDKIIISKTPVWQNIHFGYFSEAQIFESLQKISPQKTVAIKRIRTKTDEFTMERIYEKEVNRILKDDPYIYIKKAAANALMLWYVPSRYFYDNSMTILLGRKIYIIFVNFFSIISLLYMYRKKNWKLLIFSLLVIINFTVPYMIGHAAMTRFKLDFEWYQLFMLAYLFFYKYNNLLDEVQ